MNAYSTGIERIKILAGTPQRTLSTLAPHKISIGKTTLALAAPLSIFFFIPKDSLYEIFSNRSTAASAIQIIGAFGSPFLVWLTCLIYLDAKPNYQSAITKNITFSLDRIINTND
jgi:hypothetical protein